MAKKRVINREKRNKRAKERRRKKSRRKTLGYLADSIEKDNIKVR